ncbi:MAG: hypothetical protein IPK14_07160 [Blastocatellia bacterium]|nr:hypothetical protein [Blastocatellia bacterium]MBL8196464.1 hypothetical protein [Blastocatellia bacterium]MBN8722912.1 hypothetical protein [Acidobacteriota bacterium]
MNDKTNIKKPLWVKLAVSGLSSRITAWICFWLSILLMASVAIYTIWLGWTQGSLLSILFIVAPIWYYLAIKWMDRNDQWN